MSKSRGWRWGRVPHEAFLPYLRDKKLRLEHVGLYAVLTKRGGKDGRVFGNRHEMADEVGINVRTLYRYFDALEAIGALTRTDHYRDRFGKQVQLIVLTSVEDFDPEVVSPESRPVCHQSHEGRVTRDTPKESTEKETPKRDSAPTIVGPEEVSASCGLKDETGEEDLKRKRKERREKDSEKKKRETGATLSGALIPVSTQAPIDTVSYDDSNDPPARRRGSGKGKTSTAAATEARKAVNDPDVIAAYKAYQAEIKLQWPNALETKLNPQKAAIMRNLLKQVDHDGLLAVCRIAVWDWTAIQETIQPWYTKERQIPDLKSIAFIFDQLAACVGTGVTSTRHRCSYYHSRFISKSAGKSCRDENGHSLAEQMRRKKWAERHG